MSRWLRIAGRPPLIAQAPTATRILALARNSRSTCTFSALQTPPSISAMSQGPQCLMSVSGERSNSAMLGELEQPLVDVEQRHVAAEAAGERRRRQPHLDLVLTLRLAHLELSGISQDSASALIGSRSYGRSPIGVGEADALDEDRADRTDVRGAVGDGEARCRRACRSAN